MVNQYQQRLVSAIQYFSKKVKYPSKTKMFKLLYFMDIEHIKETGLPITNLEYYTWEYGPVPREIWYDLKDGRNPEYFSGFVKLIPISYDEDDESSKLEFRCVKPPDMSVFTPRQIRILEKIAIIYRDAISIEMSKISHEINKPWSITKEQKGMNEKIDLTIAIESSNKIDQEKAKRLISEREEMIYNFPF